MKRFVSYLYSIYNNQKIHNAGFARIELRTGRSRIDIHLKENGYGGKTGTVYLFIKKKEIIQGISIGNITFRNNQADFRYEQPEENIGQTSFTIPQMQGILIQIDEQTAFLSQWDEEPIDTSRFEIWQEEAEGDREKEIAEGNYDADNISNRSNSVEKIENEWNETSAYENALPDGSAQSQKENASQNRGENISSMYQKDDRENAENTGRGDSGEYSENDRHGYGGEYTENIRQEYSGENAENIRQEYSGENAENTLQEYNGEYRNGIQQGIGMENNENITDSKMADSCLPPIGSGGTGDAEDGQPSDIRTAELQPQIQKRDGKWEQTWRYMLRSYPVLRQFEEKKDVLCVRIEIKDVRLLPEKYWSMINNSFLLHGFFNYRYLAFGRIGMNWFVGIPGIYQNQEHVMASIFGFPDFLPQKEKNEQGGQPGYWYRILDI